MSATLLSVLLLLPATSETELLSRAERAFAEGLALRDKGERGTAAFRASAQAYEALRDRGIVNADLYRNLGNSYLLAGDLPRAILAYREGLRVSPRDPRLRELLASAREQVVYPSNTLLGRPSTLTPPVAWHKLGPEGLYTVATLAYIAACLFLTRWWMLRRSLHLTLAVLSLLLAVASSLPLVEQAWTGPPKPIVVIARDGVLLRKGNGDAFAPWYETPINRGVEATLLYDANDWRQIELAGGEVGWVRAQEVITEPSPHD
jgi:tetratricopeptide (TPR) repeat protein